MGECAVPLTYAVIVTGLWLIYLGLFLGTEGTLKWCAFGALLFTTFALGNRFGVWAMTPEPVPEQQLTREESDLLEDRRGAAPWN